MISERGTRTIRRMEKGVTVTAGEMVVLKELLQSRNVFDHEKILI